MEPSPSSSGPHARVARLFVMGLFAFAGLFVIGILGSVRSHPSVATLHAIESWQLAFGAVFAAGGVIMLVRRIRSRAFWEAVFTVTLFLGVWYALLLVLPLGWALAVASALTFAQVFVRTVAIHDLFFACGAAGVAIDLAGWFPSEVLLVLLVALTAYDIVAARPEGPIAELAASLIRRGIVPGAVVPTRWRMLVRSVDAAVKSDAALLGAGDLIVPLTLVARASFASTSSGLVVLAGLVVGSIVLTRKGATHPRAALPALAAGVAVPFTILYAIGLV